MVLPSPSLNTAAILIVRSGLETPAQATTSLSASAAPDAGHAREDNCYLRQALANSAHGAVRTRARSSRASIAADARMGYMRAILATACKL